MKYEMNVLKVIPMTGMSGKAVPNQYIILNGEDIVFQSYDSIVAEYNGEKGKLIINNEIANYSKTTMKYFYRFVQWFDQLCFYKDEIKKAVKSGARYTVINFNDGITIYNED